MGREEGLRRRRGARSSAAQKKVGAVELFASMQRRRASLARPLWEGMAFSSVGAASPAFLFPKALAMAGHCYMIFGALAEATERCSAW